jgi:hypothetical protein
MVRRVTFDARGPEFPLALSANSFFLCLVPKGIALGGLTSGLPKFVGPRPDIFLR